MSDSRELSFDFCYGYFLKTRASGEKRRSCLELGYYLASWGMLRGSSALLDKNIKYFERVINIIRTENMWGIDVCDCTDQDLDYILLVGKKLKTALSDISVTDTLLTKIMLGVWGCVPAYDRFVKAGYKKLTGQPLGEFNKASLKKIQEFYQKNKERIDSQVLQSGIVDYDSGQKQSLKYPKAKIIDVLLFEKGKI